MNNTAMNVSVQVFIFKYRCVYIYIYIYILTSLLEYNCLNTGIYFCFYQLAVPQIVNAKEGV